MWQNHTAVKWVIQDPRNTNGDRSLNSNWSYLSLVYSEGQEAVVLIQKRVFFFALPWYRTVIHFYIQDGIFEFTNAFIIIFSLAFVYFLYIFVWSPLWQNLWTIKVAWNWLGTPQNVIFCCYSFDRWINMDGLQFINGILLVLLISTFLAKGKLIINLLSASNRIKGDLSLARLHAAIRTSQRKKRTLSGDYLLKSIFMA